MSFSVAAIFIYPVKSLRGIQLNASLVDSIGLQYDRRWMLVDENNQFITQRKIHALCLFTTEFTENGFKISHPQQLSLFIPWVATSQKKIQVTVWNDTVDAMHGDVIFDEWFSNILKFNCKLVYMPHNANRLVDTAYAHELETVSFADGYPVLIIGEAALNELNNKLEIPLLMNRFRPSIVFAGGDAHAEDQWRKFEINDVVFEGVKPCARCILTTVEQETAITGKEPLKTLSTYRNKNNKIYFGQNVLIKNIGAIKVGDEIKIISTTQPPFII
jgi:hypothetical protein